VPVSRIAGKGGSQDSPFFCELPLMKAEHGLNALGKSAATMIESSQRAWKERFAALDRMNPCWLPGKLKKQSNCHVLSWIYAINDSFVMDPGIVINLNRISMNMQISRNMQVSILHY
jgi:hypothetical protein